MAHLRVFAEALARTSIFSRRPITTSDLTYAPVRRAASRERKPRAMNSRCARRRSTLSRIDCSTKLERLSPSCNTFSAACRSSGSARRDGNVAVFIAVPLHCRCNALCRTRWPSAMTVLLADSPLSRASSARSGSAHGRSATEAYPRTGVPLSFARLTPLRKSREPASIRRSFAGRLEPSFVAPGNTVSDHDLSRISIGTSNPRVQNSIAPGAPAGASYLPRGFVPGPQVSLPA